MVTICSSLNRVFFTAPRFSEGHSLRLQLVRNSPGRSTRAISIPDAHSLRPPSPMARVSGRLALLGLDQVYGTNKSLPDVSRPLLSNIAPNCLLVCQRCIDVSVGVYRDPLSNPVRLGIGDQRRHLAISRRSDPDTLHKARIGSFVRLRIGNVKDVVLVDIDAIRPAELTPL